MATYYKSEDGSNWSNENDAHAANYAYTGWNLYRQGNFDGAIAMYNKGFALNPGSPKYRLFTYRGHAYLGKKDYDRAMEDFRYSIDYYDRCDKSDPTDYSSGNHLRSIYSYLQAFELSCVSSSLFGRGRIHYDRGNRDQAIADWKLAADLGSTTALEALSKMANIQYTPRPQYSSSSSSYSSSSYSDDERSIGSKLLGVLFGIIGAVVLLAIVMILLSIIDNPILNLIGLLGSPVVGFILGYKLSRSLAAKLIILAVLIGAGIFVWFNLSLLGPYPGKAQTVSETSATATVNANVNFRKEPTTGDNIIRQLQQGDTVTLTGETNGGWTQILHNGDIGWVSTEFLDK